MMEKSILRLRRAAAIRELADLGMWTTRIAQLLKVTVPCVHQIAKDHGIAIKRKPHGTWFQHEVRRLYALNRSPVVIARLLGSTPNCVKVTAHNMGLSQNREVDSFRFKRGFSVPPTLKAEYKKMRKLGMTCTETGWCLGLLPRPPAAMGIGR